MFRYLNLGDRLVVMQRPTRAYFFGMSGNQFTLAIAIIERGRHEYFCSVLDTSMMAGKMVDARRWNKSHPSRPLNTTSLIL